MSITATDIEIIERIGSAPDDGFRLLVRAYGERLYRHIRRITLVHADAEDALQETLLRAYRNIGSLRSGESLAPWLYRIATREALRQRRSGITISIDEGTLADARGPVADEYFDFSDLEAVHLQQAIQTLPPRQQTVFNLRYYDDFDYSTIASIVGSTADAAKVNYHIAKQKITRYMTDRL
ncbi:MAG: RNA polymerase sigma factor [Bacteroides sp.]|nr:RNA polymerase sigma factor [Bacteroides sp.]